MKKLIFILSMTLFFIGCSSAPVAMKTNKKYFAPVKSLTQNPSSQNKSRFISSAIGEKELSQKNTMIELLKKENQQLRERLAKLEKRLLIIQS